MKKTKSSFASGPANNKNMDHPIISFKMDKMQDNNNDFTANFNRKLTYQDPAVQPM